MYNNPYMNSYSPQMNIDRINNQIAELEKIKSQLNTTQQQQPTAINQTFQLTPSNPSGIRYVNTIEEVNKEIVLGDTPFFSKDLTVLWIKNIKGEIKSYELTEIIQKDEKDMKIDFLQAQIEELKKGMRKDEPSDADVDEPIKNEKSTNVSTIRTNKKK